MNWSALRGMMRKITKVRNTGDCASTRLLNWEKLAELWGGTCDVVGGTVVVREW